MPAVRVLFVLDDPHPCPFRGVVAGLLLLLLLALLLVLTCGNNSNIRALGTRRRGARGGERRAVWEVPCADPGGDPRAGPLPARPDT
ncbi:hypothetical protein, partial [Streptomyces sp. PTD5-9]|uniref:hypothetical protein n=1 Tax=Streptomyces sp. PTD5-9 TaxID=3120150 RepID=UPI0030091550